MEIFQVNFMISVIVRLPSWGVYYRQRWHQTWRKESFARVYARYVSSEILWSSKDKNFLRHFGRLKIPWWTADMEFSAASKFLDICDLGFPKHLLTTLKMMNLAEENLKWSLRENDKGVLLKLVWNKRGRSKNWLRSRLNRMKTQHPAGIRTP